jgi:hypothetical protein
MLQRCQSEVLLVEETHFRSNLNHWIVTCPFFLKKIDDMLSLVRVSAFQERTCDIVGHSLKVSVWNASLLVLAEISSNT